VVASAIRRRASLRAWCRACNMELTKSSSTARTVSSKARSTTSHCSSDAVASSTWGDDRRSDRDTVSQRTAMTASSRGVVVRAPYVKRRARSKRTAARVPPTPQWVKLYGGMLSRRSASYPLPLSICAFPSYWRSSVFVLSSFALCHR